MFLPGWGWKKKTARSYMQPVARNFDYAVSRLNVDGSAKRYRWI